MPDDEPRGPTLPPWHSDWQRLKGECQMDVARSGIYDYPRPVRMAVLRDMLASEMNEYERSHFEQLYEEGELDEPNSEG